MSYTFGFQKLSDVCMAVENCKSLRQEVSVNAEAVIWCMQVVMSTENLFNRVRLDSKISYADEVNPLYQLEVIGNFVSDLGSTLKAHNQQIRRNGGT